MNIEIRIQGDYILRVMDLDRNEIEGEEKEKVMSKLKTGEYLVGLDSMTILRLEDFKRIYMIGLDVLDANYEFAKTELN